MCGKQNHPNYLVNPRHRDVSHLVSQSNLSPTQILTNSISIRESGQAQVLGTALDVPMALMNHSCEPNALTIFEGSELRVRSLRPIQAGEELMQCYTDVTCDVLMRRERLKEQFFFDCACKQQCPLSQGRGCNH